VRWEVDIALRTLIQKPLLVGCGREPYAALMHFILAATPLVSNGPTAMFGSMARTIITLSFSLWADQQ
jgi:hypothetical protein